MSFVPKRRPSQGGGASLFPFLAVLLCTMGALIMLLVVIARNVREQYEVVATPVVEVQAEPTDTAETEPAEPENVLKKLTHAEADEIIQQLQMGAEEADWMLENIADIKKKREKDIEEKKTRLALMEKETQRVQAEIDRLVKLAEQLEAEKLKSEKIETVELEALKKRLEERQKQREQIELELAELQKEAEQDKKSYAIIPYRGTSGTFRRPIYVECQGDKVIIQPEGVELYPDDFLLLDRPDNPFDAVLRVIRQYYIETNQIVRGSEPYPLLIVRPSGVDTYKTTREAIGSWIKEYGYELVDEDWKIEYPQPSDELKERIEKQLETSRTRMKGYLAAMNAAGAAAAQHREQYRLDHRGQLQRADGFGGAPPSFGSGSARRPSAPGGSGPMAGPSGAVVPGSDPSQRSPLAQNRASSAAQNGGRSPDISLSPFPQNGNGSFGDMAEVPESLRAEQNRNSLSGQPTPGQTAQAMQSPQAAQSPSQGAYGQSVMPPGYATSGQVASGQPASVWNPNQTAANGQSGTGQPATEQREVLGILEPESGTARHSNQMPNILQQQPGGANRPKQATAQGSGSDQGPIGAVTPGSGEQAGMQGLGALSNMSAPNDPQTAAAPMHSKTEERKENWALRGAKPFSAAISRPVKIQCDAGKFVLLPQKGLLIPKVIPITDSVHAASDKLVQEIWEYMETWGVAGEKMFWRPVLEVTVLPGGEQRFQELKYLLRNSGLVIEDVGDRR